MDWRTGCPHSEASLDDSDPDPLQRRSNLPHVEEFIGEVFPEDSIELAWEVLGDLLTPDRSIQKAICMVGEGGNGKGVFAQFAVRFVGAK